MEALAQILAVFTLGTGFGVVLATLGRDGWAHAVLLALAAMAFAYLAAVGPARAHESRYAASVVSVYDGDTIRADLDLGLGMRLHDQPVRVLGLDAPEIRAGCAYEAALARAARDRLAALLASEPVEIEAGERDRYGRLLGRVYAGGQDVAEVLIAEGLARPYEGGRREGWC